MVTKQEQMEKFIEDIICWWEGEDCTCCPLHRKCQYEGRDMGKEIPPCVLEYFGFDNN